MEELYSTLLPHGRVHCMTWSGANLVAVSLSEELPDSVTENKERMKTNYLAVFDPDRPWIFHKVCESRSVVHQLEWCQDGTRLLALDQNNIIHIWRMTQQNINTWVCAQKQEADPASGTVIHAAWLEYKPKVTINHSKQVWTEALEFQQFSPLIKMLTGNAFICVYSNGKVQVTSTNLNFGSNKAETKLEGKVGRVTQAKSFVTPNGSVLCAVGCEDGQVRVYSLSLSLSWGSEFKLSSSLATGVPRTSTYSVDTISHLVMLPLPDGCTLHACYNGTELCQWSVKDITTSGSYQAKKEKVYHAPSHISCICASSLCLCSQDTAADNEIIVLDEMSGVQSEGRGWPVEVLLVTTQSGDIIVLNRYMHTLPYMCLMCIPSQ
jgi:WD40 repeat protein